MQSLPVGCLWSQLLCVCVVRQAVDVRYDFPFLVNVIVSCASYAISFLEDRTGGYLGAHQAGSLASRKRLAKVQADSSKDTQVRLRIKHHPFSHAPPL